MSPETDKHNYRVARECESNSPWRQNISSEIAPDQNVMRNDKGENWITVERTNERYNIIGRRQSSPKGVLLHELREHIELADVGNGIMDLLGFFLETYSSWLPPAA